MRAELLHVSLGLRLLELHIQPKEQLTNNLNLWSMSDDDTHIVQATTADKLRCECALNHIKYLMSLVATLITRAKSADAALLKCLYDTVQCLTKADSNGASEHRNANDYETCTQNMSARDSQHT